MRALLTNTERLTVVRIIASVGLCCGILLSLPLWAGPRFFPPAPLFDQIYLLLDNLSGIVIITLLLLVGASLVIRPVSRVILPAAVLLVIVLLADQMRWRAAVYLYSVMLAGVVVAEWRKGANEDEPLHALRIVLASIYFWAGIHKLNYTFIVAIFPWIIDAVAPGLPTELVVVSGFFVPFIEAGIGIGLLCASTRKIAVVAALLMHSLILLSIGPIGHNWNTFVWPWNIAMASLVFVLFWRTEGIGFREICSLRNNSCFYRLVVILFIMMPATNMVGFWDAYPSFSLYTGDTPLATLRAQPEDVRAFPPGVRSMFEERSGYAELNVQRWAVAELGAPPYPERRVFQKVFDGLCAKRTWSGDFHIYIQHRPSRLTGQREGETHYCRMQRE